MITPDEIALEYLEWTDFQISNLESYKTPANDDCEQKLEEAYDFSNNPNQAFSAYGELAREYLSKRLIFLTALLKKHRKQPKLSRKEKFLKKLKQDNPHVLLLARLQLQSQAERIATVAQLEKSDANLALLTHLFRNQKELSVRLACIEKVKGWNSERFQVLYSELLECKDEEAKAYLRLLTA
jgi:hypothetical protein